MKPIYKVLIGLGIAIVIVIVFTSFSNKKEPVKLPVATKPTTQLTVDGYTREDYARMGYSTADINLIFDIK